MPAEPRNDITGLLLVDKPQDWTSHDVVNCIKHQFRVKKIDGKWLVEMSEN